MQYRYGVALAITLAAAAVRLAFLPSLGMRATFVTFYPAVMLAALYGGLRAGLLATVLSALLADYFWIEPPGFTISDPADWLSIAVFLASCTMISWITEAMHRAQRRATAAKAGAEFAADRARVAEALRSKEAELKEAQRVAQIGSWHWDAKTDVTVGSAELLRIYGLDPAAQSMPDFRDQRGHLYPIQEWERLNAAVQRTLETGVGYELDIAALRGGTPIWITTRSEAVRDANGQVVALRGTVQDITERKRAEEALQTTAQRFYSALSSMYGSILLVTNEGQVEFANQSFCALFNLKHFSQRLDRDGRERDHRHDQVCL